MLKRNTKLKRIIATSQVAFILTSVNGNITLASDTSEISGCENVATQSTSTEVETKILIMNSAREIVDATITINEQDFTSNNGTLTLNLQKGKQYKYTIKSDGYKNCTGSFTAGEDNTEIEAILHFSNDNGTVPTQPRVKLNKTDVKTGEITKYDGSETDCDVTVSIDNSFLTSGNLRGYKVIEKAIDEEAPTDGEWKSAKAYTGQIVNTNNGYTRKYDFTIAKNINKRFWIKAVSDQGTLSEKAISIDVNIVRKYGKLFINNTLMDKNAEEVWYTQIPTVRIEKNDYKTNDVTTYTLENEEGEVIEASEITDSKDINIDKDGQYKLNVTTKNGYDTVEEYQRNIKVDTEAPSDEKIVYKTEDTEFTDEGTRYLSDVTGRIYVQDAVSGISNIKYHFEDKNGQELKTNVKLNYDINKDDNGYYVEFKVKSPFEGKVVIDKIEDVAGNNATLNIKERSIVVNDTIPTNPTIVANTNDGKYDGEWTNKDLKIKFGNSTSKAGIKGYKVLKKKLGESEPTEKEWSNIHDDELIVTEGYSQEELINTDVEYTLYVRAVSNTNLESDTKSIDVKVRKTLPNNAIVAYDHMDEDVWHNNSLNITLNNGENTIPTTTYYKLWNESNGENEETAETIEFDGSNMPKVNGDGIYELKIWTVDIAGNISKTIEKEIKIDATAPTNIKISYNDGDIKDFFSNYEYGIFNNTVNVKIYAEGEVSGLKSLTYHLEDENKSKTAYSINSSNKDYIEFEIPVLFKGKLVLDSISDMAGNTTDINELNSISENKYGTQNIIVDNGMPSKPIISGLFADNHEYVQDTWTNQDLTLKISNSKALSGIAAYEYIINDGTEPTEIEWANAINVTGDLEENSLEFTEKENRIALLPTIKSNTTKTYWIRAISNAGIKGEVSNYSVKVQKTKPKNANIKIENPNNSGWYTDIPKVTIEGASSIIPVKIYAKLWNVNTENEDNVQTIEIVNGEIKSPRDDGKYKLKIWSVDAAGNRSEENEDIVKEINLDTTAPTEFSIQYDNGSMNIFNGNSNYDFFSRSVLVRIYSKDETSGISEIKYHYDGEVISPSSSSAVKKDSNGYYCEFIINPQFKGKLILDSVKDGAGNETIVNSANSINTLARGIQHIIVDSKKATAPMITAGNYTNNTWTNQDVNLKVEGSYALSGVKEYLYIVNDGTVPDEIEWNGATSIKGSVQNAISSSENRIATLPTINSDINKTYWVRAVSNSNVKGEISSFNVKVQKTLPRNTTITYNESNAEGWYNNNPTININSIMPIGNQAPIKIYYKIWNKTAGESEENVNENIFNGDNLPVINNDGEYELRVWTVDEAGNRCSSDQDIVREFKMDRTAPAISLNFDNNNAQNEKYYNTSRTATVTVDELNFNASKVSLRVIDENNNVVSVSRENNWIQEGNSKYSTTIPFDTDGNYKIEAVCSDKADNQSNNISSEYFVIDKTMPELNINDVVNLSANNSDIKPVITFSDTNMDANNVEYNLIGLQSGNVAKGSINNGQSIALDTISEDDNYTLVAKATDKAGNSVNKQVAFSVNKNGSTFELLNSDIKDNYVTESFKPEIKVNNIDQVSIISLTLNGEKVNYTYEDGIVKFDNEINEDGKYTINMDVRDAAGNENSMEPIEFIMDTTKPVVLIDGVEDGEIYTGNLDITISKDNAEDEFEYIELNGKDVKDTVAKNSDGSITINISDYDKYTLNVAAKDKAGNETIENVKFEITNSELKKEVKKALNNKAIVAGVLIAVIIAGFIVGYIVKKKK